MGDGHWRDRAEEARAIAGTLRGAEPLRIMLEVAAGSIASPKWPSGKS